MSRSDAISARLDRSPVATTFQVDRLAERVLSGELRVPRFQRAFRWDRDDKLALFDSMYRGFPIGTLLLWKHPGGDERVRFDRLIVSASPRNDVLWIVDGQQRITTLADTLLRPAAAGDQATFFDLDAEEFVLGRVDAVGHRVGSDPGRWLPMSVVLDSERLLSWLLDHAGLAVPRRNRALAVGRHVREYQIPAYVVETDDERLLRTIFDRTNRSGKRLSNTEVFEALFGSMNSAEPAGLGDVVASIGSLGFGRVAEDEVLRALQAIEALDPASDFTQSLDRARVPAALREAEAALRRVVDFLRTDGGFPHRDLLPYALPMTVLSSFFHRFPAPVARSRTLLRRWLWRGALAGQLTGDTVGLRTHLACIHEGDEEGSVQRLLALVDRAPSPEILRLDTFRRDAARSVLHLAALVAQAPRDLRSGALIDVAQLLTSDRDPYPTVVSSRRQDDETQVSGIGNRLVHPHLPPASLRDLVTACDDVTLLASHAVSPEAAAALRAGDAATFLEHRVATVRAAAAAYFARQAEPEADDSPSLASMLVED